MVVFVRFRQTNTYSGIHYHASFIRYRTSFSFVVVGLFFENKSTTITTRNQKKRGGKSSSETSHFSNYRLAQRQVYNKVVEKNSPKLVSGGVGHDTMAGGTADEWVTLG